MNVCPWLRHNLRMRADADPVAPTRLKADITAAVFAKREELFRRSGNPVHAWHAYRVARHVAVSPPSWVLDCFDKVAEVLTATGGPRSPQAIAKAVGLKTKGGPSKVQQALTDERDLDIVLRVSTLHGIAKSSLDRDIGLADHLSILQRVAEEYDLSLERVQAIFQSDGRFHTLDATSGSAGHEPTARVTRSPSAQPAERRATCSRRGTNSGSS